MTAHSFSFNVDLTNPGQFLACCGLLELANCLDREAVGWFDQSQFYIRTGAASQEELIAQFVACSVTTGQDTAGNDDEASEEKSPPLQMGAPFKFCLNWWQERSAVQAGFKTWGGGQTVLGFFDGMRRQMVSPTVPLADLLIHAAPVSVPRPFSFDSRLSVLTLIDLGFFREKLNPTFSPAVEALTLVGLQRFRPATIERREQYAYSTWIDPLPVNIAAAVAYGLLPALAHANYKFPFVVRTGGKYKAFGPALPQRSLRHV